MDTAEANIPKGIPIKRVAYLRSEIDPAGRYEANIVSTIRLISLVMPTHIIQRNTLMNMGLNIFHVSLVTREKEKSNFRYVTICAISWMTPAPMME